MARRSDGRWSRRLLDWTPLRGTSFKEAGKGRRPGRPLTRWEDPLDKYFSEVCNLDAGDWRLLATNRQEWSSHVDGFARYGVH